MDDQLFAPTLTGNAVRGAETSIVLVEWRDAGGGRTPPNYIAPLHIHHDDDEAWYVVEGTLGVRIGERDVEVPAGGAAMVPRGTPHTYWNAIAGPTRYVLVMTPRIQALIDALHALEDSGRVAEVFAAHRSEYLGWP